MTINWQIPGFRLRLRQAIQQLTGEYPSIELINEWLDEINNGLQVWCVDNMQWLWMTGEGVIDAATLLVERAYENGNIDDEGRVV